MTYKFSTNLDQEVDFILPCQKNALKEILDFIPLDKPDFDGSFGTSQMIYGATGNRIYLLGLGEDKELPKAELAFRKLCFDTQKYWNKTIQVYADRLSDSTIVKAALGIEMAQYEIGKYKTSSSVKSKCSVTFIGATKIKKQTEEGQLMGQTVNRIKALVDAPPNIKTPEYLGNWAKESATKTKYKCTVLKHKQLVEQSFDAVLAVGQGSVNKPVVIINEYKGSSKSGVDIALVGKGITFDSGGLSIKPSTNLHYMKSDMGGAAVVLGIIELVATLKLNINIVGIVASAENAVGSNAYRPGDVINSHSGKTIEIIDTDAEGRLVLADGISYALKTFNPEYLIDLATLTGSVVRTLGYAAAGMFTNNLSMAETMSNIGNQVHERVWPLPLYDDFDSDLHSDIADIRNFSGKPIAGAITAAKFLETFTEGHEKWMHLDIAGVSFGDSHYAKMKSASGYGIQLLLNFIKGKAKK